MDKIRKRLLGAHLDSSGHCEFKVWAPYAVKPHLEIIDARGNARVFPMLEKHDGYYSLALNKIKPGDSYYYLFGNQRFADPAADFLPQGITGPAAIVERTEIASRWPNIPLREYIIYEIHVGTYTPEGQFTAIINHLDELKELGITAIELMPIAQFSGERNWGYDGVYPFAVQNSYGGPQGLKALIQACHSRDIAVILDVVYNHIGPEGNHFAEFGPYFTEKYQSPWGQMLNFDDQFNHHVRRYFIENALHWFIEYDIDALRLDALHAIIDTSAYPFLEELADAVQELTKEIKKPFYLIAENDANDVRLITEKKKGGYGIHAQWNDDFHHAIHSLLTGETQNYYQDFGRFEHLIKAFREGFVYSGEYSVFRKKPHGRSSAALPSERLVVCLQNHDQIGNRAKGERLNHLLGEEQLKLAAGLLLTSPFIPLLFMGEEYADPAPFLYFISHSDPGLIEAVRQGRKKEFSFIDESLPDPQDELTFQTSKLNHHLKQDNKHRKLWNFYKQLIHLRRSLKAINTLDKNVQEIHWDQQKQLLTILKHHQEEPVLILASFSQETHSIADSRGPNWTLLLNSYHPQWTSNFQAEWRDDQLPPFGFFLFKDNQYG